MAKRLIEIRTPDGTAQAGLFPPEGENSGGGVIVYMDAFGLRPALDQVAERISGFGHTVLVPDLYYREGPYGPYSARTAFSDEQSTLRIRAMMAATTQAMTQADTGAFIEALESHGVSGPIGTTGYCMGGARSLNAAAAHPGRIAAAASFHGGNLAGDAADSPHNSAARIKARVYVGSAGTDKSFPPEQSARLAEALRTAGIDHMIENYAGTAHGWCIPDHNAHDAQGAERHFRRLETLFAETLRA